MNGQKFDSFNLYSSAFKGPKKPTPSPQVTVKIPQSPPPEKTANRRSLKVYGLALLAILGYTGGFFIGKPNHSVVGSSLPFAQQHAISDRALPVQVFELESVSGYSVQREYTGEVKAARTSNLGFELSGNLVSLGVQAGEAVVTGQAIARLDSQNLEAQRSLLLAQKQQATAVLQELQNGPRQEDIMTAQANVKDLEDQLTLQQIKQIRREELYRQGAIAQEALDEVYFGAQALGDRLVAAQSQLQELQVGTRPEQVAAQLAAISQIDAQIEDLDITIAKSIMRAPYSGFIGERLVDEGTVVNAGQAIVRLVEGASPEVEIGIPEEAAAGLAMGSSASIEIGGQTYQAKLKALKPEIDLATRTRPLVLQLEPAALQYVVPQQIARLTLDQTVPTEGHWLPITALVKGDRGLWSTYAVVPPDPTTVDSIFGTEAGEDKSLEPEAVLMGIVERRDVEVLHVEGERALVRGAVEPGDRIIEAGVQRIVPGQKVLARRNA